MAGRPEEDVLDGITALGNAAGAGREQVRVAQAVRRHLLHRKRKAKEQAAAEEAAGRPPPGQGLTFGPNKGRRQWSADEVLDFVFVKSAAVSAHRVNLAFEVCSEEAHNVRACILHRYRLQRSAALQKTLEACAPLPLASASLRIKWDETEQHVGARPDEGAGVPACTASVRLKTTARQEHVLTVTCWWKTSAMLEPQPWIVPVRRLQRTTAECIWQGLEAGMPFKFDFLPKREQVLWLWLLFCGDKATSNVRLTAQVEMMAPPGVLTLFSVCLIHAAHRGVMPLLHRKKLVGHLYRAAHVLSVSTYWSELIKRTHTWMQDEKNFVITHTDDGNEVLARAAGHILDLTLGEGLPMDKHSHEMVNLREELLRHFTGNWSSASTVRYRCYREGCGGGDECRSAAVRHAMGMLYRSVYARKVQIPSVSRWWKCQPLMRQVLLGVCLHRMWPQNAPTGVKQTRRLPPAPVVDHDAEDAPHEPAVDGGDWHWLHGFRVQRTSQYLCLPDTAANLIVSLRACVPATMVKAWLMDRESDQKRLKPPAAGGGPDEAVQARRIASFIEFLDPAKSPVTRAWAEGTKMLQDDNAEWDSLSLFSPTADSQWTMEIWSGVVPALAHLWFACAQGAD